MSIMGRRICTNTSQKQGDGEDNSDECLASGTSSVTTGDGTMRELSEEMKSVYIAIYGTALVLVLVVCVVKLFCN